jgi:hypothetical protein
MRRQEPCLNGRFPGSMRGKLVDPRDFVRPANHGVGETVLKHSRQTLAIPPALPLAVGPEPSVATL